MAVAKVLTAGQVGIRLSPQDREKLEQLAAELDRSPAQVVRHLIRMARPSRAPEVHFEREERVDTAQK